MTIKIPCRWHPHYAIISEFHSMHSRENSEREMARAWWIHTGQTDRRSSSRIRLLTKRQIPRAIHVVPRYSLAPYLPQIARLEYAVRLGLARRVHLVSEFNSLSAWFRKWQHSSIPFFTTLQSYSLWNGSVWLSNWLRVQQLTVLIGWWVDCTYRWHNNRATGN